MNIRIAAKGDKILAAVTKNGWLLTIMKAWHWAGTAWSNCPDYTTETEVEAHFQLQLVLLYGILTYLKWVFVEYIPLLSCV